MQPQFWFESWQIGGYKTSFHRKDIHSYVRTYTPPSQLSGKKILVPLCGKTNDLIWFRQYADRVVGVELVKTAIEQFFEEQNLEYQQVGDRYEAENLILINRDIFDLKPANIGPVDLVYDRASLIAFPLDMRLDYLQKIDELMLIGAKKLLITLEYGPSPDPQPPFSISPEDVELYYGNSYAIEHIEQPEIPDHPLVKKWGLNFLKEHAFMLTKKANWQRPSLLDRSAVGQRKNFNEALTRLVS